MSSRNSGFERTHPLAMRSGGHPHGRRVLQTLQTPPSSVAAAAVAVGAGRRVRPTPSYVGEVVRIWDQNTGQVVVVSSGRARGGIPRRRPGSGRLRTPSTSLLPRSNKGQEEEGGRRRRQRCTWASVATAAAAKLECMRFVCHGTFANALSSDPVFKAPSSCCPMPSQP